VRRFTRVDLCGEGPGGLGGFEEALGLLVRRDGAILSDPDDCNGGANLTRSSLPRSLARTDGARDGPRDRAATAGPRAPRSSR
jgi:hypothetical protein